MSLDGSASRGTDLPKRGRQGLTLTYRDEAASLEERYRNLRRALDENRAQSSALTDEEAGLHRELATLHSKLEAARRMKRQLPLANMIIASPCDVPWAQMVGDDRVRHCAACKKDVHNLSAMTRDEIDGFLARQEPSGRAACVSLFQRVDGTVLTADCPVGVRRRRLRGLVAVTLGTGATAVLAFTALALLLHAPPTFVAPPMGQAPVSELAPVTSVAYGYVEVEAPVGARVYDGSKLLGTAPLSFVADPGIHVFRIEDQGRSQSFTTLVRERQIAHVSAFFPPRPPPLTQVAGGIGPAPFVIAPRKQGSP